MTVTVGELMKMLVTQPKDRVVYLSIDPEGNRFHKMSNEVSDQYGVSRGDLTENPPENERVLVFWPQ